MAPLTLTALPSTWTSGETQKIQAQFTATTEQSVANVGERVAQFLTYQSEGKQAEFPDHLTFAAHQQAAQQAAANDTQVHEDEYDDEEEDPDLLLSDPKDWREQDNYAILGLSKLRWRATPEDIKRQFHKKVLLHHPDKKAAGGNAHDDKFFKCIQKANEILNDPVKRRQFDSVDPELDDTIPSVKAKGDYFDIYCPLFERESRFSKIQPVPGLGDNDTDRETVESFYEFWVNFDSWRSFEHLDKEEVDSADNRDNKRYMDKKNRAERARLKKEETARLRILVEQAMKLDPRIARFRKEERERRNAKKASNVRGGAAAGAKKPAALSAAEIAAKEKAEAEAKKNAADQAVQDKATKAAEKKKKEEAKNAIRAQKKIINKLAKENNYFAEPGSSLSASQLETQFNNLEKLFAKLKTPDQMTELATKLTNAVAENQGTAAFDEQLSQL